jgi:DNA-binding NarL/FixJ family response regulator
MCLGEEAMIRLPRLDRRSNDRHIQILLDDCPTEPEDVERDHPEVQAGRVLLVDPSAITRESLVHLLRTAATDIKVDSVPDLAPPAIDPPDLILLNIHGSRVDELQIQRQISELRRSHGEYLPIAVIADLYEWEHAVSAIDQNALRGYIPTNLSPSIAAAAVRLMLAGGTFAPLGLTGRVSRPTEPGGATSSHKIAETYRLTYREAEVLRLLQCGKPNKIIAFDLAISESTVKVHVRNIMKKLNATNRTQVALLLRGVTPITPTMTPMEAAE